MASDGNTTRMDINEISTEKESNADNRDNVVGGFTIVRDKLRYRKPTVKEILPYWITNSVKCSNVLEKGIKVKEFDRFDRAIRKNLKHMGIKRLFPSKFLFFH